MTRWFENMSLTKRAIVDADLNEQGERNVLNLGHTVAHALEAAAADEGETLLHGEAVAIGLRFALFEAEESALATETLDQKARDEAAWIEQWLQAHLPVPELTWPTEDALWHWMNHDKKNRHGVRDMAWRHRAIHCTDLENQLEATWKRFLRLTFRK